MKPDIAKVLSYEIKKELADRYFGFRRIIEEDTRALDQELRKCAVTLEQRIGLDLARVYILLQDDDLIHQFLDVAGLEEKYFYDPYLLESSTIRQRVLTGLRSHGLTRRRRFRNLILDSYALLEEHVGRYREQFGKLSADLETIREEIKIFYEKNDLGNIMNLLRGIDACDAAGGSGLEGGFEAGSMERMAARMQIEPPTPIEQRLPIISPVLPLPRIKKRLKELADEAFRRQERRPAPQRQKS